MVHFYVRIFLVGAISGFLVVFLLNPNRPVAPKNYKSKRKLQSFDDLRYGNGSYLTESQYLFNNINVLCIILVKKPKNVKAINETWGQSCNSLKFVNITSEKKIPLPKQKKGDSSWTVLCKALKQVPETHKWVLIAYDYTFALIENLRWFVFDLNPDKKYYLGHAVQFWGTIYNSGGAGYVLSRGTIKKLRKNVNCSEVPPYMNREDYYLGKKLSVLGIHPVDTRDFNGFTIFHPHNLFQLLNPSENNYKLSVYPQKCCSQRAITFQAIEGDKMYTYYYLLYVVQLFYTGDKGNRMAPKAIPDDEVWKEVLRGRNVSVRDNMTAQQYYEFWEELIGGPGSPFLDMKRDYDYNDDNKVP